MLSVLSVLSLTACADDIEPPAPAGFQPCSDELAGLAGNPVIAATATSAEPRPALPRAVLVELAEAARRDDACVTVIGPDGATHRMALTPHRSPGQVERGPRRALLEQRTVQAVHDVVGRLAAQAPGLDPRAVISRAARAHPEPTTLYLITSGVSTTDPTDIRRIGWDNDGNTIGTKLRHERWLPDLTGWTIRFVGVGDVAGAQPQLTDPVRERLVQFWLGICAAAGASRCDAEREYVGVAEPTSTNEMPVVELPTAHVAADRTWLPTSALFAIGSASIGADADDALRGAADRLRRDGRPVTIIGRTDASTGSAALNLQLSQDRADAVRDRLIGLGVPAELIVNAVGVGARDADPAAERADPRLIARNRHVELRFGTR